MTKKLLFLFALLPSIIFAQHSIKGTFSPAKNYKWVILYKVTPTTSMFVENTGVDEKGNFEIKLDSNTTKGVYRLVYAMPQEDFNFDIIYNAEEDIELTFSKTDGIEFKKSKENKLLTSYTKSMLLINESINKFYNTKASDQKAFNKIIKTLTEAQSSFEKASKGTIAYNFIKANSPYIPSKLEDIKTYSKNLKTQYLKGIDFNNSTLQSSDFLIQRMISYVFGMTTNPDDEEAFKANIDDIARALSGTKPSYQKTMFEILWNQFFDIENEPMANYIATEYLIPLSKQLNDYELTNQLITYKNTSINAYAPDFYFKTPEGNGKEISSRLYQIDTHQRYIVVFWSSSCSHCMEELPHLKKYVSQLSLGDTKVIAIGLEDEPYNWNNEVTYYPDFIHVYGKGKWKNSISKSYGVSATPTYFVLNKKKQIIAKPEDFKALKEYFEKNHI